MEAFYFWVFCLWALSRGSASIHTNHMIINLVKTKEIVFRRPSACSSLPSCLTGIKLVVSAKLIGVTFCSNLKFDEHVKNILTICSQRCYLLKCLKGQGLPAKQLSVVFCAIVMSRILFALPAWGGFLSYDLVAKFDAFFQKKLFAGVTAVSLDVCLCYCMRRMLNCSVKWLTIRNIVFTSCYLRKKLYLWNFMPLIVYLHCHNVIITCTSIRLYCVAYLKMLISTVYKSAIV